MPRRLQIALTLILLALPATAQTPESRLNQTARAAVRLALIVPTCSPFYLVDRVRVEKVEAGVLRDGRARFGDAALQQAMSDVRGEFAGEVEKGGAAAWCPAQRERFKKLGAPGLIGRPLP